jgi:hypothetical protein
MFSTWLGRAGVAAAVALSACSVSDQSVAPEPDGVSAAFNFTNGLSSPGPFIVRIANSLSRVITTDPADGLIAIHGRVSGLSECTNTSTRVPVDIQLVRTPSDAQAMAFLLTGDDNDVAIYEGSDISDLVPFDPARFCPFIATRVPAFTGQVQYRLHQTGQGNVLFIWEGFLTRTSDGALFHYVEKQYAVPHDGVLTFVIEDILLQQVGR